MNGIHLARSTLAIVAILVVDAEAAQLTCYEESGTRKHTCYDPANVRRNGDLRGVAIFSGGPNGARPTGFTMIVDCKKSISTLQDRDGVNFGGGPSSSTSTSRALTGWICEESKTKTDAKLRMF